MAIWACASGNGAVRSPRNNVPLKLAIERRGASQGTHEKPLSEVVLNPVTYNWRKDSWSRSVKATDARTKRCAARWECSSFTSTPLGVQPGENGSLKVLLNVCHMELGKPDMPHPVKGGRPTARKGDGLAGRGCWRKRMPSCNGRDRAAIVRRYPARKRADFQLVSAEGKLLERQNSGGC